ncbi:MAG: hypothetical protein HQL16_05785 [Candidatus Omnitrophica bacterium]|nr:hypothetical protein [Candidatus Omnitrophota bacterium]
MVLLRSSMLNNFKGASQKWTVAALAGAVFFGIIYFFSVNAFDHSVPGGDTSAYVLLARSLKETGALRSVWSVGSPLHGQLSTGFPMLLVPFLTQGGIHITLARYMVVVFAAGSFLAVFFLFRRTSEILALGTALLTAGNLLIFLYGRSVLSEVPYLFLSLAALMAWNCYERAEAKSIAFDFGLAVLLVEAFLMRSAGIFLILAILGRLIVLSRRRGGNFLRSNPWLVWPVIAVVALWCVREAWVVHLSQQTYFYEIFAGDEGRGGSFLAFLKGGARGAYAFLVYAIPQALSNVRFSGRSFLAVSLSAVFLYGFLRSLIHERRAEAIYVAMYLGFASFWPWVQTSGARYVAPFVPFLIYYFLLGVKDIYGVIQKNLFLKSFFWMAVFLVAGVYGAHGPWGIQKSLSVAQENSAPAVFEWVRSHVSANEAVFSFDPPAMFYNTARRAPDAAVTTVSSRSLQRLVNNGRVAWVVDDTRLKESGTVVAPLVKGGVFQKEFEAGTYIVYRVKRQVL